MSSYNFDRFNNVIYDKIYLTIIIRICTDALYPATPAITEMFKHIAGQLGIYNIYIYIYIIRSCYEIAEQKNG